MRFHLTSWRAALLLAFLTLLFGISFTQVSSAATGGVGWVRLGDLSETFSPVDIYVVSSSGSAVATEKNLSYGTVLSPLTLPAGSYTVDVRNAGASPSSAPAAAAKVTVQAGRFYTVAPVEVVGSGNARRVVDLPDSATTPSGDASVQAIDAAYQNGTITFHCNYSATDPDATVLSNAAGGTAATSDMPVGTWTETATGSNGKTTSEPITLAADTDRTEIILDTTSGLQILNLLDTVGDKAASGAVVTGLALPQGPGSPVPWLALIGAGSVLAVGCGVRLFRTGTRRRAS